MNEDRLQRLTDAVEAAHEHLANVEAELAEIEDVAQAEKSHDDARTRDAREQLSAGETYEVVVENPPGESGRDAVARIDGIVTFVKPNGLGLDIATTAKVKLTDVGDSQAHAIAIEVVD